MGLYLPGSSLPRPAEIRVLRALAERLATHDHAGDGDSVGDHGELDAVRDGPFLDAVRTSLRDSGIELSPTDRQKLEASEAFAKLLLDEGLEMAGLLESKGIPVVFLKGAALMASGIVRPCERALSDVDLLVPPESRTDALRILGVDLENTTVPIGNTPEALRHSCSATSPAGFPIDLHWFANRHCRWTRADAGIWEHAVTRELYGRTVRLPTPEDLLVLSIAHGTRKDSETRMWAWDVIKILSHKGPTCNWERIIEVATGYRLGPVMAAALRWARAELGLPIPDGIPERLAAAPLSSMDRIFLWLTQSRVDYMHPLNFPFRFLDGFRNRRARGFEDA